MVRFSQDLGVPGCVVGDPVYAAPPGLRIFVSRIAWISEAAVPSITILGLRGSSEVEELVSTSNNDVRQSDQGDRSQVARVIFCSLQKRRGRKGW